MSPARHPAIEALTTVVLEDRVVLWRSDAAVFRRVGKLRIVLLQLVAQQKAAIVFDALFRQFLPSRLDREIRLAEGDDLPWPGLAFWIAR